MKYINQQIKDAMAKKVVGRTTEIYKAVVRFCQLSRHHSQSGHKSNPDLVYAAAIISSKWVNLGTIVCDLERHQVIDLLPVRAAPHRRSRSSIGSIWCGI